MRLPGRGRLPSEAKASLRSGERALAYASVQDGGSLVGTGGTLIILGPVATRLPWERIQAADWDLDESRLAVSEIGEYGEPRPTHVFDFAEEPTRLLQLVRERVNASIVLQRRITVSGKLGFNVIGRRSPEGGPIEWMVEFDAGVDPEEPSVQALRDEAMAAARAEVG